MRSAPPAHPLPLQRGRGTIAAGDGGGGEAKLCRSMTITVFIPTQLRNYTNGATQVPATGTTVDEALRDLDARYPGLRFRVIDEQNRPVGLIDVQDLVRLRIAE